MCYYGYEGGGEEVDLSPCPKCSKHGTCISGLYPGCFTPKLWFQKFRVKCHVDDHQIVRINLAGYARLHIDNIGIVENNSVECEVLSVEIGPTVMIKLQGNHLLIDSSELIGPLT
jgi:hypothetical protein